MIKKILITLIILGTFGNSFAMENENIHSIKKIKTQNILDRECDVYEIYYKQIDDESMILDSIQQNIDKKYFNKNNEIYLIKDENLGMQIVKNGKKSILFENKILNFNYNNGNFNFIVSGEDSGEINFINDKHSLGDLLYKCNKKRTKKQEEKRILVESNYEYEYKIMDLEEKLNDKIIKKLNYFLDKKTIQKKIKIFEKINTIINNNNFNKKNKLLYNVLSYIESKIGLDIIKNKKIKKRIIEINLEGILKNVGDYQYIDNLTEEWDFNNYSYTFLYKTQNNDYYKIWFYSTPTSIGKSFTDPFSKDYEACSYDKEKKEKIKKEYKIINGKIVYKYTACGKNKFFMKLKNSKYFYLAFESAKSYDDIFIKEYTKIYDTYEMPNSKDYTIKFKGVTKDWNNVFMGEIYNKKIKYISNYKAYGKNEVLLTTKVSDDGKWEIEGNKGNSIYIFYYLEDGTLYYEKSFQKQLKHKNNKKIVEIKKY